MKNSNLHKTKQTKNEEFYTQLTDVAKELMHYKAHFKDKGVPITFMDKYNPKQFEIIWQASENTRACCPHAILHDELHYIQHSENRGDCGIVNEKRVYSRILIRKKVGV